MDLEERGLPDFQASMNHYRVPGIGMTVFREGIIEWSGVQGVAEAGTLHKITAESPFHACSMSKMVTAIGVMRLVQEGLLDLEEDISRYLVSWRLPENAFTDQRKVTLRSLLAHQGGFVDPEGSFDVYYKGDPFPTPANILEGNTRYYPEPAQVKYMPDSQFSYSDAGYTIVEQIIEDVTGESFAQVMERAVIAPLGLSRTFFWGGDAGSGASLDIDKARDGAVTGHDKHGRPVEGKRAHYPNLSGAGLWTTATEFALLSMEVTKAWNGDTASFLRPDLARMMLTGHGCAKGVGLGVFLPKEGKEPHFVSQGWGVGSQCMMVAYPELNSGIVVMTNSEPGKHQNEALVGEVIREISKKYGWPSV
ncbi:Putative D-alanyl-D-alanine carboxypeptidase [Paenibacillus plantiphilus]|uniref:D-alanyl-D-alanine carboxypeptidase n=1 Tax=Paenibacillus plantiphilus TaxID=2905650 RepID=A0ABM9C0G4_9BACL|nr:serine hydrolase domain-containing protein [Paenibacillus plantiphilus]CAH1198862.1 Putative D-alanyl-D-alanine carboxypeptidase [Paenibacillus plantiphilus]